MKSYLTKLISLFFAGILKITMSQTIISSASNTASVSAFTITYSPTPTFVPSITTMFSQVQSPSCSPIPTFVSSITMVSQLHSPYPSVSYSPQTSIIASPTSSFYRPVSASPSLIAPTITNDDNVTFSKFYFLYVGIPAGMLMFCLIGYILDMRQKNAKLKRMSALSSVQTVNVARVPLNKIPPFSAV